MPSTAGRSRQEALARATPTFAVMSVCPGFTLGPDDPVGAPANKLIRALVARRMRFAPRIGFGWVDVRDFASGVLAAAERGRPGQRYLLSAHNTTTDEFLGQAADVAGVPAPRFTAAAGAAAGRRGGGRPARPAAREAGADRPRRPAARRPLRLVGRVPRTGRAGLGAPSAPGDARRHRPLGACATRDRRDACGASPAGGPRRARGRRSRSPGRSGSTGRRNGRFGRSTGRPTSRRTWSSSRPR